MKQVSLKGANPDTTAECLLEVTGDDIFVVYSGRRIAMRGDAPAIGSRYCRAIRRRRPRKL